MSFTASWLDLRAPADAAARDAGLLGAAARWLGETPSPLAVDLGCGSGATVTAFAGRAPADLRWRLVDRDPALLALAAARHPGAEVRRGDLGVLAALPLAGARLVTASALLDLMPEAWIEGLAERVAATGAGVYAALSYDGRLAWDPALPADAEVAAGFDAHQRGDKGMGPAAGPAGAAVLARAMAARGYAVRTASSPWRLGPEAADLQRALVAGIAAAATEVGVAGAAVWGQARRAVSLAAVCTVGHTDVLAVPRGEKAQSKTTSIPIP